MSDQQRTSYPLRPSPQLRKMLEEAAQASGRSLHAEIIARLEASFRHGPVTEGITEPAKLRAMLLLELENQRVVERLRQIVEETMQKHRNGSAE